GFLEAAVDVRVSELVQSSTRNVLLHVHEGKPVRVIGREYPCLGPERTPADIGSEVDSFLSELPGGTLLEPVDARSVDALFGPKHAGGSRPSPYRLNPWSVYSPDVYEKAAEHLKELFRSEGYLSASVGPVFVQRRRCQKGTMDGQCIPVGPRVRPQLQCSYDPQGLPAEEPAIDPKLSCVEDRSKGVYCEPEVIVNLPIKLGPRSFVQGVEIEGNSSIPKSELLSEANLPDGAPLSQSEVDRARRRLLDRYQEEGFAFAELDSDLEFSPDHRHAKVRFLVSERKRVRVSRIVVRGARTTSENLIRSRIALVSGDLYRRSLVRKTEERLSTLGVFSSVTVTLEDPYVPASEKVVVITVQEKKPQYLDVRPGFSTGEGFRIMFEYGHRNLGGQGVQLTLRSQLGFLPPELIIESDVRRKYEGLGPDELLERRNTATVEFPDIGLGPLFRLRVEGVDVRDNSRDFGLSKDAGILSLFFLPERRLSFQIAGSLERNDATIFGQERECAPVGAFRVPQVPTFVVAQRVGANWDRRDNPLDATSGTFVSASAEYVRARPIGVGTCASGDFIRYTNRVAGYVRLSQRGLALAASFRWGFNQQLRSGSHTYPDRLFFMGGVDSLRGFLQDSLVPEDVARRIMSGQDTIQSIPIRGGDLFVNPRVELRIPLTEDVQTALFVDAGNLWTEPSNIDLSKLRYATGTGLRVGTPIGPLVFDYGFNVDRVLEELLRRARKRPWEDGIGAFHFSIGLF
ncbi:MAG TPA: BamA/TamA family outer membrane protein, partial [Polyangiaceae bacterium]|nr:BamA/TamA family outer membrane protein [Polyangiaceae bacterium]